MSPPGPDSARFRDGLSYADAVRNDRRRFGKFKRSEAASTVTQKGQGAQPPIRRRIRPYRSPTDHPVHRHQPRHPQPARRGGARPPTWPPKTSTPRVSRPSLMRRSTAVPRRGGAEDRSAGRHGLAVGHPDHAPRSPKANRFVMPNLIGQFWVDACRALYYGRSAGPAIAVKGAMDVPNSGQRTNAGDPEPGTRRRVNFERIGDAELRGTSSQGDDQAASAAIQNTTIGPVGRRSSSISRDQGSTTISGTGPPWRAGRCRRHLVPAGGPATPEPRRSRQPVGEHPVTTTGESLRWAAPVMVGRWRPPTSRRSGLVTHSAPVCGRMVSSGSESRVNGSGRPSGHRHSVWRQLLNACRCGSSGTRSIRRPGAR